MVELSFQNPLYLWYLLSIPLLIAAHIYFLRYAKFRGLKFANFEALKRIKGEKFLTRNYILLGMRIIILICLILAAAGTIFWYKGTISSNDFVLAIDTSASMTALDVQPTRIDAAKLTSIQFLDKLEELGITTRVGLLTFSGSTYILEPVTRNIDKVKNSIESIEVRREGGTDMAGAVVTSTNMLYASEHGKSIIVVSDGSITVSVADDDALKNSLEYATSEQVIIHTLGIGSETGPIGYLPEYYNASAVYNERTLKSLANKTQGTYHQAVTEQEIEDAYQVIAEASEEAMVDIDLSYMLLVIALLLLFLEWGLISTKFRRLP